MITTKRMWNESKGARGGNEISSYILKLTNTVIHGSEIEEITLWSDNCLVKIKMLTL